MLILVVYQLGADCHPLEADCQPFEAGASHPEDSGAGAAWWIT